MSDLNVAELSRWHGDTLTNWTERALGGISLERDSSRTILSGDIPLLPLAHAAGLIRRRRFGNRVQVHVLNNVQNGACPEDCGYCGQAKSSTAPIQPYKLKSKQQIIDEAGKAKESGAYRYCMVLSGRGPSDDDIDHVVDCIREVKSRFGLRTCLSSGLLDEAKARRLKEAGLDRLNHNINTSARWYPSVCSTHTHADRIETLNAARSAGLQLCAGMIVGMGETSEDILDVAYSLRDLGAESIPVNFLVPIPGNELNQPACNGRALTPEFCLRVLCMFRFVNPAAEIRVAAGREGHLRSLQALAMEPANSLFVDGYLLTKGSSPLTTLRMLRDAGFEIELDGAEWPPQVRRMLESGELDQFHTPSMDDASAAVAGVSTPLSILKEDRLSKRKLEKCQSQLA